MSTQLVVTTTTASVPTVVERLKASLARRGIEVFAVIDHAAAARAAGLELPDETVVIFGNPGVGTALMRADPRVGLDLPLRILAWADGNGTHVAYRVVDELARDFDLSAASDTITRLSALMPQLVEEMTATS